MKKILFLLSVGAACCGLAPTTASAQTVDTTRTVKPQLNTGPPATQPRPAPTTQPQYQTTRPNAPVTPPPVEQPLPPPATRPNPDSPSGLEFPAGSRASEQPKPLRRMFIYSNFGLGYNSYYGDGQFSASVAPAIGFRLTKRFAIGPGISYAYNSVTYSTTTQQFYGYPAKIHYNNFGVKGFAQFIVYKQFFLHGEYEVTQLNAIATDGNGRTSRGHTTANTLLAGAGYRNQFSDRFAADIVVLYNFNDGIDSQGYRNSPYGQPEIRFNFLFDIGK